ELCEILHRNFRDRDATRRAGRGACTSGEIALQIVFGDAPLFAGARHFRQIDIEFTSSPAHRWTRVNTIEVDRLPPSRGRLLACERIGTILLFSRRLGLRRLRRSTLGFGPLVSGFLLSFGLSGTVN